MEFKNYYKILGVDKTAAPKAIKQAYRRLARKYHPDVNPNEPSAEANFKDVTEAYEVVGDAEKRRKYDELGANWKIYEQANAQGGQNPFAGRWATGAGQSRGFRTGSPEHMEEVFGQGATFSDFFSVFFGAADVAGGGARPRRGHDADSPIEMTLEEAFSGTARRLALAGDAQRTSKTVDVRIPAGVTDGARIRVKGHGGLGSGGAANGDLFLLVHVVPHPVFERRGVDLYVGLDVPLTTAVLGGEVEAPTIGGTRVRLRIPPHTQTGQTFRMRGYGMPRLGVGASGDAYASVKIPIPIELSDVERAHYDALAVIEREKAAHTTRMA
jgi:curved DNA-binding protein